MNTKYWFLLRDGAVLLCKDNNTYSIPEGNEPPFSFEGRLHSFAKVNGIPCVAATLATEEVLDEGYVMVGVRESHECVSEAVYRRIGKALEVLYWDLNTQFCPVCGTRTQLHTAVSKLCPSCGKEQFPQIAPAILVLVKKGDEILLVHARNFSRPFKSLVAGFVETGETLEECVQRELYEETSLEVENIRYFGSQEWPFSNAMMVGFIAEYVRGDIQFLDGELSDGAFYSRDCLPELPQKLSLSRKMIDAWLEGTV